MENWQQNLVDKSTIFEIFVLEDSTDPDLKPKEVNKWLMPPDQRYTQMDRSERGYYIYKAQCSSCHSKYGFNPMNHYSKSFNDINYARESIENLHIAHPYMPPFIGGGGDMDDLIYYIQGLGGKNE